MSESKNPILGKIKCELGSYAEVRQTIKRGRHFYTDCECCGKNQGTKQKRQQKIWDEAEFLEGAVVVKPSNVTDTVKPTQSEVVSEPEGQVQAESDDDFNPNADLETADEDAPASGSKIKKAAAAVGVVLLGVGGGLWLS